MTKEMIIEPQALHQMMQGQEKFFLLDCRENWEHQTARIDGATLIPMRTIPQNFEQSPGTFRSSSIAITACAAWT